MYQNSSKRVVKISSQSVMLLDPLGNEGCYERKIMPNWRNFLKMKGNEEFRVDWKMERLPHNKQMDSSSCGVLMLKFAEHYLMSGEVAVHSRSRWAATHRNCL
uniref:Ubiquitin-like protease family profile domain-containing protein n=2 Tax=Nothobranchius kuhntae TaxID=321403 RepID=A0A1A8K6K5_NOTKU